MALENADFIAGLDETNPPGTDPRNQGDDHLRLIKRAVKGSFPNFVGTIAAPKAVLLTEDQINAAAILNGSNIYNQSNVFLDASAARVHSVTGESSITQNTLAWSMFGVAGAMHLRGSSNPAAPGQFIINASTNDANDFTGGTSPVLKLQQRSTDIAEVRENVASGGFGVYDLGGTFKRASIGYPTRVSLGSVDLALLETHQEQVLDWQSGVVNQVLTVDSQIQGFNCTVVNRRTNVNATVTILAGAGVTLIWLGGNTSTSSGQDLTLTTASVLTLQFINTTQCLVYGNGIIPI